MDLSMLCGQGIGLSTFSAIFIALNSCALPLNVIATVTTITYRAQELLCLLLRPRCPYIGIYKSYFSSLGVSRTRRRDWNSLLFVFCVQFLKFSIIHDTSFLGTDYYLRQLLLESVAHNSFKIKNNKLLLSESCPYYFYVRKPGASELHSSGPGKQMMRVKFWQPIPGRVCNI